MSKYNLVIMLLLVGFSTSTQFTVQANQCVPSECMLIPGDLNCDNQVDESDLSIFASYWLDQNCDDPNCCGYADLNFDGMVNYFDFEILEHNWKDIVDLEGGLTVNGAIDYLGDYDIYHISGEAGDRLFLSLGEVVGTTSFDLGVFIFEPDGDLLVSNDDDSNGMSFSNLLLDQNGTYTIVVRDLGANETGEYTLTAVVVDSVVDSGNVELTSGQTESGILSLGDIDTFTIAGQPGDQLFLSLGEVVGTTNFDLGVFIYGPGTDLIASNDDDSNGMSFSNVLLDQNGTYTIVVRDLGANETGEYTLTAVVVDKVVDVDNVVLTSGQTEGGALSLGDIDTFTITGQPGDRLFLSLGEVVGTTNFDLGVFIYGPGADLITSNDDDSDGMSFSNWLLDRNGTYTIVVRDLGANETGNYSLTAVVVDDVVDSNNISLTSGVIENGTLALGDIDTFTIVGQTGESLTVALTETVITTSFDLGVFIYEPSGDLLASNDDDSNGMTFSNLLLDQSGTYTILVRDLGANVTGDYALSGDMTPSPIDSGTIPSTNSTVALTSGQTVNTAIDFLGDTDGYTIHGDVGDRLFVSVGETVSSTSFNLGVFIYEPDGGLVSSVDNDWTGITFTNLTLDETGTYTIIVRDLSGDVAGDYTLTAVVVDEVVDVDNVGLTSGQTESGTLSLGDIDTYTISGEAGERLFLNLGETVSSTSFNLGIFIYDPSGDLLSSVDNDWTGITFTNLLMDQSGTYTIVIRDLSMDVTGDYTLTAIVVDEVVDVGNVGLTSGQTESGTLSLGDIDTYTISGEAGDRFFLSLGETISSTSFNLGIFIYGPDGGLVSSVDNDWTGITFTNLLMDQSGTYTIVIRDLSMDVTGDYTFTAVVVDEVIDIDNVVLTSGQTQNGTLSLGDIDTYTISGQVGNSLSLTLTESVSTTSFNLGVYIFEPNGDLLSSVDNDWTGIMFTNLLMDQNGTYTIVTRDLSMDVTGDYSVVATIQ